MRVGMLIVVLATTACFTPLSAMHGVVDRDEELWIERGITKSGLWALDVASIQSRDLYRWVWLRSYHTLTDHPEGLYDAQWRYIFIDCHHKRAMFEQFKYMSSGGTLSAMDEGNEGGVNALKPWPQESIIGRVHYAALKSRRALYLSHLEHV